MKKQVLIVLTVAFTLVALVTGYAQPLIVSTNQVNNWMAATTTNQNSTPPTWAFLTGLNYNITPVAYGSGCTNFTGNPAQQITVPTSGTNQCGSTNVGGTVYYQTTFNLNTATCILANLSVRVDDYARIYINGTQVTPNALSVCGRSNLNTNTWNSVFTFGVAGLLVPGTNTLIVEAGNCATVSYMALSLNIQNVVDQFPTSFPGGFSITRSTSNYTTKFWGQNPKNMKTLGLQGQWMGNWTIESSSSVNGPWALVTTHQENTSTPTTPWIPAPFNYGTYYRVSYQITSPCGNSQVFSMVIFVLCQTCLSNIDTEERSDGTTNTFTLPSFPTVTKTDPSEFLNYVPDSTMVQTSGATQASVWVADGVVNIDLLDNATEEGNAVVWVTGLDGRVVYQSELPVGLHQIPTYSWHQGLYVVTVQASNKARFSKKIVLTD